MKTNKYRKAVFAALLVIIILLVWPGITLYSKNSVRNVSTPIEIISSEAGRKTASTADLLRGFSGGADREKQLSLKLVQAQSELNRLRYIELENKIRLSQDICSLALSLRKKEKIKVRQPLPKILVPFKSIEEKK